MTLHRPELDRPFKVPFVPFVPALSALVSLGLMAGLPGATWLRLVVWMTIGIVFYFVYGYNHSEVRHRDEKLAAAGAMQLKLLRHSLPGATSSSPLMQRT